MTNHKAPLTAGVKMRIRVYSVGADGAVTQDRGTVTSIRYGEDRLPGNGFTNGGFPSCSCPRCRARQVVTS